MFHVFRSYLESDNSHQDKIDRRLSDFYKKINVETWHKVLHFDVVTDNRYYRF